MMGRVFRCLLKRELRSLFYTPLAYAILFFFWILSGLNFYWLLRQLADGERMLIALQLLFNGPLITFSLPVVVPLITMRLIAEERRLGTMEVVLTTSVTEREWVLVKFTGALIFYVLLWLPTILHCFVLGWLCGEQGVVFPDWGVIGAAFVGVVLVGLFYTAVGLFMSALTANQVVAAIGGFSVLFGSLIAFMFMGYNTQSDMLRSFGQFFSTFAHMLEFSRGVVDSRMVVFYVGQTVWLLYASITVLEWKRR